MGPRPLPIAFCITRLLIGFPRGATRLALPQADAVSGAFDHAAWRGVCAGPFDAAAAEGDDSDEDEEAAEGAQRHVFTAQNDRLTLTVCVYLVRVFFDRVQLLW